ncbi:L,D-transpeptidase family protein [Paracoccus sp. MBLB3053]|uniref:L,D-transpeptidase family protein n=1 Tax=Paracoccus aurantius TaxID=3073814 RepID=A0ABU2HPZ7_9RHOB|nr:L,D-transpeptidase family protein [Paracoccus sp. MBLB3053]MDS9466620.1 L,D-transpeptidase family protein [Paracoccus sp. MBLB3053]
MIRSIRASIAIVTLWLVASCGGGDSSQPPSSKFKSYQGPPVTQVVVKKADRKMYLVSGQSVLRSYEIDLGNQPVGPKQYEGDGRTPEGLYFIDRKNPRSRYHLSLGISYPSSTDVARAAMAGLRPGGDIMIHGLGPEGRALNRPDWTAGCIAVSDEEIEEIYAMLGPGVPIFIYP